MLIYQVEAESKLEIKSVFHGDYLHDYKGRSYILPPAEMRPGEHTCYIPKKQVWTWSGHTKGVQVARFFPKYGHFILSGSHDTKVNFQYFKTHIYLLGKIMGCF